MEKPQSNEDECQREQQVGLVTWTDTTRHDTTLHDTNAKQAAKTKLKETRNNSSVSFRTLMTDPSATQCKAEAHLHPSDMRRVAGKNLLRSGFEEIS